MEHCNVALLSETPEEIPEQNRKNDDEFSAESFHHKNLLYTDPFGP